jgi:RNA ligase (TIGR02306 family)
MPLCGLTDVAMNPLKRGEEVMRKMVTLRVIKDIQPIENADAIEVAIVDGWKVVVKKGQFSVGDFVVYFEIDSFLPKHHEKAYLWDFLEKQGVKVQEGVEGYRLRTIKLRKQVSQGLIVPSPYSISESEGIYNEELDLSSVFGVTKWEPPLDRKVFGNMRTAGSFPNFIRKTDEERVQNIFNKLAETVWIPTLKLDGSSITVFYDLEGKYSGEEGKLGVCSRNLELKDEEGNRFWEGARNSHILGFVKEISLSLGKSFAVQGELLGPGIQGNRETADFYQVWVFNIFDIDAQEYLPFWQVFSLCQRLGIRVVPSYPTVKTSDFSGVEDFLQYAEGPSLTNKVREGIVFKSECGKHSFKAISNTFLLKGGE